ncbi:NAD-dependent epimerase/dehydratase family protein [Tatumella sp. UBA2305]|uniref:NAD-dependent epimerase/dehydratase family protein n=1 Tax=Tatumella sp. UBA2305 TaxID=1947647 RepID=UPI0025DE11DD|nr:NAD(P)-dependent oxidoreductase [Tatumella sp. UBA2305]
MTLTVAITGATGFIGRQITKDLLARGCRVRALTRSARQNPDDNLVWVRGSLENPQSLAELVSDVDAVVHCAGQVRGSNEAVFTECNVTGSVSVMQAAQAAGSCKKFLFISSLAARHPELSWYANSKYVAEQQLQTMSGDMTLGIFRPTAVYGPGDKELKPLLDGLLRGVLPQLGRRDATLTFIHVTDMAAAVRQWLLSDNPQGGIYELCDGVAGGYSWSRMQQIGAAVRQRPVRLIPVPLALLKLIAALSMMWNRLVKTEPMLTQSKIRELTHPDWTASNQQLTNAVGWVPEVSLERALREGLF